jgi:hypothetical protein
LTEKQTEIREGAAATQVTDNVADELLQRLNALEDSRPQKTRARERKFPYHPLVQRIRGINGLIDETIKFVPFQ